MTLPLLPLALLLATQVGQVGPIGPQARRSARPVPTATSTPNIVLIIADDFGVDFLGAYGEGAAPPCTPNIDSFATDSLLFRNAWTNPVCTPTRAAVLTGRYGFRTGMGGVGGSFGLPFSELTLPEMLTGYNSSAVGKWHLAGNGGNSHPNSTGFGYFAGALSGGLPDYFQWPKVVNGVSSTSTNYATTDTADEAIAAMGVMSTTSEPWFLYVAFNSPHSPWHVPPAALCPAAANCNTAFCMTVDDNSPNWRKGKAMVEAMDTELGRLLAALDQVDPDAYVVFIGDNGTPGQLSQSPFPSNHAKGTLYEGGVNVPLIVRGPGVVPGESQALVSSVDLFATFAELAEVSATTEDSISMVPYFTNPALSLRSTVYSETFSPNGGTFPYPTHVRAIRGERYKLIRTNGQADEFYDLWMDAFEGSNLLPSLSTSEQTAHDQLLAELTALGVN